MKVNYDGNTKKFTIDISKFDRIVNLFAIIIICACVLYAVFRPNINELFASRESQKPDEQEVTFTSGNQLSWEEYRSIIGNKKLMRQYAKKKKTVTGYLQAPPAYDGGLYVATIVESADATDSTVFMIKFTRNDYIENINAGMVTITSAYFYCGDGYSYLYCKNPIVVNEATKG